MFVVSLGEEEAKSLKISFLEVEVFTILSSLNEDTTQEQVSLLSLLVTMLGLKS